MQVVQKIEEVRAIRWQAAGATWGLIPTMGALHEGHLALVRQARAENNKVGVSIFVNPKQFNRRDDLLKYPRHLGLDLEMLREAGVDLVWTPAEDEVYPLDFQTYVDVEHMAKPLEGAARPGHFRGVATVVAKLFNVFQPQRAYFGQKDAQQVAVIQQMVRDLAFNLEVVVCPTVRESDGLAMSSRNQRLSAQERMASAVIFRALMKAEELWRTGWRDGDTLRLAIETVLKTEPLARIDYISAADPHTLNEIQGKTARALLSVAVYIGAVRLIDNIVLG